VARFLLVLFSFIAVFGNLARAKDVYYIGFIGNSLSASSMSLYNTLSLTVEAANNSVNSYETDAVFFNDDTATAADQIKNNGSLLAVIGCFSEKESEIIDKINDIPLISVWKNYAAFNEKEKDNCFRVCPSETQLAEDVSRFSIALGKNKAAAVYSEGSRDYMRAAEGFIGNCKANRIWADYFKSVPDDRDDFTNILLRLRDLRIQTIYFAGGADQAALLSKKSKDMNVGAVFMGTDAINSRAFIKKAKAGADGACFASIVPDSIYKFREMRPVLAEFRKRFENEDMHMPYVFDAANMVLKCLAGGIKSGQDMKKALQGISYDGTTGRIDFNKNGLRAGAEAFYYVIARKEVYQKKLDEAEEKKYREAR
jgi:ABC-type branched-subunit amino acid transport system substrate-binding protein